MRILYFSRAFTTHDRRFLAAIAGAGHDVGFLQLDDDGVCYEARELPARVVALSWAPGKRVLGPADVAERVPELQRVLASFKPDVVHAGPIQTAAFMVASSGFAPLVAMSWGSDVLVDADRDETWRTATAYTLQHAARIVCDCDAVRVRARELAGLEHAGDTRFVQFPWGLELSAFPLLPTRARAARVEILSLRSWDRIYGIDLVIEAFRLARLQDPRLHLVLLGDGPLAPQVDAWIAAAGVAAHIDRPGRIAQADLGRYYAAADLYLSCALSDGTSVSLLEAMASGLTPVVTDAPGNREWVLPTRGGFLAAPNAQAFAAALTQAAALSPQQHAELRAHNRVLIEQRADWNKNVTKLLAAYEELALTPR